MITSSDKPRFRNGAKLRKYFTGKPAHQQRQLTSEKLEKRELLAIDTPVIAEFVADNDTTLTDQFGRTTDWIEVFNPTDQPMPLAGWHLTDNSEEMDKWTFPDVTLDSGQFMVLFASGDDLTDTSQPLHTNFRLSAGGEYLGLTKPDMSLVQEFKPNYPVQFSDVSYGVGALSTELLTEDSRLAFHVPTADEAALATSGDWAMSGFNDESWETSANVPLSAGAGYAIGAVAEEFDGFFEINVERELFLNNGSIWFRQEFDVADTSLVEGLLMTVQYDDGFVAYLNGVEVARSNTPDDLTWNAEAELPRRPRRTNEVALTPETFDIGQFNQNIVQGTNVLGIHALNDTAFDDDFLMRLSLTGISTPSDLAADIYGYLDVATPGTANRLLVGGTVEFSIPNKIFAEPLTVELTASIPGQTIRYTTDGEIPTGGSQEYTGPLQINESTLIRAAAFTSSGTAGPVSTGSYTKLAADAADFTSDMALVVIDGGRRPSGSRLTPSYMTLIPKDPETGRAALTGETDFTTRAGLRVRGSSTAGNPKLNLAVEFWDDQDADKDVELLGMPAESDWVFFAPYNFDRTAGARNAFFYEIGNQTGQWAPRTRFVEVFHNLDGDDLERSDLTGVYVVTEKIKSATDRVPIDVITPEDTTEPEVTGGWIWKIDRADPGDSGLNAGGQNIKFVEPKESEVEETREQLDWARDYWNNFRDTLANDNTTWEQIQQWVDVRSWIDHAIINHVSHNPDALRLSGYLHKDREGPVIMGPLWDCDRCMGSEDGRDTNPLIWTSGIFNYTWWRDLFDRQPNMWQAFVDRWAELREEVMTTGNVRSIIDNFAAQLAEAQVRNYDRWPQVRPNANTNRYDPDPASTWESEVIHLKNWLQARVEWIDSRFVPRPTATPSGGKFNAGRSITLSADSGDIYYTLDGSDPRLSGGEVAPDAKLYGGPFTLEGPAIVTMRARVDPNLDGLDRPGRGDFDGSPWSAPASVRFDEQALASASNLRITEVNYNPTSATVEELTKLAVEEINNDEFEYVEISNISDDSISLEGVKFERVTALDNRQGIVFNFAAQVIAPGEHIVVAENVAAFQARYGNAIRIAAGNDGSDTGTQGQFGGNLENAGESIRLVDQFGSLIHRLSYDDRGDWPLRADGGGSSLELIDADGDPTSPSNWQASSEFDGSPGASGRELIDQIVLTEVLPSGVGPAGDMIELHNPTSEAIDIKNWSLSDDDLELKKYVIAESTVIPPGGYLTLTEQQTGFGFEASRGGQLFVLQSDDTGRPLRVMHTASFGNALPDVSLGRSSGGDFIPLSSTTFGARNSGRRIGDVIVSEVYYSPADPDGAGSQRPDGFEFFELYNNSESTLDLVGWRLTGDVDFEFETSTEIAAGKTLVMVPFNPDRGANATVFQFILGVNSVDLAGDFRNRRQSLSDQGSEIILERPLPPPADDRRFEAFFQEDSVSFLGQAPWPTDLMGNGNSLTRISNHEIASNPANWVAAPASPGTAEFTTLRRVGDSNGDGAFNQLDIVTVLQGGKYLSGQPADFSEGDWDGDGVFDQKDIVVALQSGNYLGGGQAALSKRSARFSETDRLFAAVQEEDLIGRHFDPIEALLTDRAILRLI